MKKTILYATLAIALFATSCKKNLTTPETPAIAQATKVNELKASETFKWKTSKTMVLNVTGISTLSPVSRTLTVTSADGKEVFFKNEQLMSASTVSSFVIPAKITEVVVNYGKITKKITLSGTSIQFNYTQTK